MKQDGKLANRMKDLFVTFICSKWALFSSTTLRLREQRKIHPNLFPAPDEENATVDSYLLRKHEKCVRDIQDWVHCNYSKHHVSFQLFYTVIIVIIVSKRHLSVEKLE